MTVANTLTWSDVSRFLPTLGCVRAYKTLLVQVGRLELHVIKTMM